MRIKTLRNILEVAECKSINKAANRVYISHQALRATINALEKDLDCKIFNRSQQGVQLTEKGEAIISDIKHIVEITNTWEKYKDSKEEISGEVPVAITPLGSHQILSDVVEQCRITYPELVIKSKLCRRGEMLEDLRLKRMIGFLISAQLPEVESIFQNFAKNNGYEMEVLWIDQFEIILNVENPLAKQSSVRLKQLKDTNLIMYPNESKLSVYNELYNSFSNEKPLTYVNQFDIIYHVIEHHDSGAIFPSHAKKMKYFNPDKIVQLPIENYKPSDACLLFYPKKNTLTPAEKIIVNTIRESALLFAKKYDINLINDN